MSYSVACLFIILLIHIFKNPLLSQGSRVTRQVITTIYIGKLKMFSALIMCQTLCEVMGGTELNKSWFLFRQMREKEKEIWLR